MGSGARTPGPRTRGTTVGAMAALRYVEEYLRQILSSYGCGCCCCLFDVQLALATGPRYNWEVDSARAPGTPECAVAARWASSALVASDAEVVAAGSDVVAGGPERTRQLWLCATRTARSQRRPKCPMRERSRPTPVRENTCILNLKWDAIVLKYCMIYP